MYKKSIKLFTYFIILIIAIPTLQTVGLKNFNIEKTFINEPTAPIITGPDLGEPGIEYNFTFISIDPLGFDLFYYIDWGDGNDSEWTGPYESNVSINISHTWEIKGNYTIIARTNNTNGTLSDWSEGFNIQIAKFVDLEIGEIVGGMLGITTIINNTGIKNATGVVANVTISGGTLLIGDKVTNDIGIIEAGNSSGVYNVPVLGFGLIDIKINVRCNETANLKKTASGFLLFFYIIMIE